MGGPVEKGHAIGALVLGGIEVVCGLIIIILSVVLAGKASLGSASPWWAGVMFAVPGILGIIVGITKNKCCMIAFMVLNIIAFVIQGVGAIIAGIAVALYSGVVNNVTNNCVKTGMSQCMCRYKGTTFTLNGIDDCSTISQISGMLVGIVVMLVIAALITLGASILGCISSCCSKNE